MYNILHKYKPYLLLLIKLIIVFGAFYFIFQKLNNNQLLSLTQLKEQLSILFSNNIWLLLVLLLFTDANWFLEIFKWKTLASIEKNLSFMDAFEQCLASLTTSIITPNRIGEYGAKALFFKKEKRKKIMLLNLVGNLSQLTATVFFGTIGLIFFIGNFNVIHPKLDFQNLSILIFVVAVLFLFRKNLQLKKIELYLKKIPKVVFIKTLGFSFLRYLVFSHQFYLLTILFGIDLDYFTTMNLVFCMYLMASIIPSLSIFDWVIKGSIAVWLFNFVGINELTIVTITTIMWVLNFVIPALLGSIFVLNFKLVEKEWF
jgi:hypothetical protein